jgi:hypothetical protein
MPIYSPYDPSRPLSTIVFADQHETWFRDVLKENGVVLEPGSPFDRQLRSVGNMARFYHSGKPIPSDIDPYLHLREAMGTDYLIRAIHRERTVLIPTMKRHWVNFQGPDVLLQYTFTPCQQRNKVWEVLVAAIVSRFCFDTELNERHDVLCTRGGRRWALECKVFNTDNMKTNIELIMKGVAQVDDSDADVGMVVVNLTGFFEHDLFWKRDEESGKYVLSHVGYENAVRRFWQMDSGLKTELKDTLGAQISPSSKVRGVLGFTQTFCPVMDRLDQDAPIKMTLTHTDLYFTQPDKGPEEDFASAFRHSTNGIDGYSFNYPETG